MNPAIVRSALRSMEAGWIPDALVRVGIRHLCRQRLRAQGDNPEEQQEALHAVLETCADADLAPLPEAANEQHYELPAAFFSEVLGKHRKYSCCYWPDRGTTLDEAEEHSLALTAERARLADGQDILELGCGWGSLTTWMAERYPNARVTAVSNSHSQRQAITERLQALGRNNVRVITADINDFEPDRQFDRVVSVEMFEHVRNHRALFSRISRWLKPDGTLFAHVFCHRQAAYTFESTGPDDWLGRYFFTGGIMPSDDLFLHYQDDLRLVRRWRWSGEHYRRTAEAWLDNMDRARTSLRPLFAETYGQDAAKTWWIRWRVFFMSCAELFGYAKGSEWWVSHYLFEAQENTKSATRRGSLRLASQLG